MDITLGFSKNPNIYVALASVPVFHPFYKETCTNKRAGAKTKFPIFGRTRSGPFLEPKFKWRLYQ